MDCIVIGSGIAGLCATYELGKRGCQVMLLEKEQQYGGNGKEALTGINMIGTDTQDARSITDSSYQFKKDIYYAGSNKNDSTLVDLLVTQAKSFVPNFLKELDITLTDLVNSGGHSIPRTHKPANWPSGDSQAVGKLLVNQLVSRLQAMPNVHLLTSSRAIRLLVEGLSLPSGTKDTRITGVVYVKSQAEEITVTTKTVIVCTGGYMACRSGSSLLAEYTADLCTLGTGSGKHADGEGIKMVRSIGGELIHMNHVQFDGFGIINQANPSDMSKDILPSLIRSAGAIVINSEGKRICNELDLSKKISTAILQNCSHHPTRLTSGREQPVAYVLINQEVTTHIEKDAASILQHEEAGKSYARVDQFCAEYNVSPEELQKTFEEYERAASVGVDQFGKKLFPVSRFRLDEPLWMIEVTPVLHHSNGGIHINASAEVVTTRSDGTSSIILGLYAAGECTGGVNGTERLIGNGLLESIVFGNTAAHRAAETAINVNSISLAEWTPLRLRHRAKLPYLSIHGLSHLNREGVNDIPSDLYEFCFDLPSSYSTATLPPGTAIAVRANINGKTITRHYTPISSGDTRGSISLYLKALPDHGTMSRHLFFLRPGCKLEFIGPTYFPKMRYADNGLKLYPSKMVMIAGGSGVSPMLHLINDVFHRGIDCKMILIWGVRSQRDLIFRRYLDSLAHDHPDRFQVVYCVDAILEAIRAEHLHVGEIDSSRLRESLMNFPPTDQDMNIIICGPPKMSVSTIASLGTLGYSSDHIFSYNS